MIVTLQTERVQTLADVRAVIDGNDRLDYQFTDREAAYEFIRRTLVRFDYPTLSKPDKGIIGRYLAKMTGLSRAQMTRLVGQHRATGRVTDRRGGAPVRPFERRYTSADTLHSDRGAPMTSKCTAQLLADLGITRSLSRPQVSDDNPFSEAQFKTLKYHPGFPGRFDDIHAAIAFCRSFFPWYNTEHRHGGIAMLTPDDVHHGRAHTVLQQRERDRLISSLAEGQDRVTTTTHERIVASSGLLAYSAGLLSRSLQRHGRVRANAVCSTAPIDRDRRFPIFVAGRSHMQIETAATAVVIFPRRTNGLDESCRERTLVVRQFSVHRNSPIHPPIGAGPSGRTVDLVRRCN